MQKQSTENARCPECGGEPEHDPRHNLRALGYLHDDVDHICRDCGNEWTCGVPIGDPPEKLASDLRCDACVHRDVDVYGRINWVRWQDDAGRFAIAAKCPECYYVWTLTRDATNGGALLGDPTIEGNMDDADEPFVRE